MADILDPDYLHLVNKRKQYQLPREEGFINPTNIENGVYDTASLLEPFANWHSQIPANILLVGQDWGGLEYYTSNQGKDYDLNPTCKNLKELFHSIGMDIGSPTVPIKQSLHFSNIIPFIRKGAMQGSLAPLINDETIIRYANNFTAPLISIVKPKIIITLGLAATKAIFQLYNISVSKSISLKKLVELSPFSENNSPFIFPVYHCGSSTVNRNRKLNDQKKDWQKIREFI